MDWIKRKQDFILSLAVFSLVVIGLVMIYSVSKYYSLQITNEASDKLYLKKQLIFVVVGIFFWIILQSVNYQVWKRYSPWMLPVTIMLLLIPYITGGASERWVDLKLFNFQPSELAKLTMIIYLSGWFAGKEENYEKIKRMFFPFVITMSLICYSLFLQKDLGTMAIFVVVASVIFMVAGSSAYHLISVGGIIALLAYLMIKFEPYRMQRLLTFLNPETDTSSTGYHINNALIAIGSGGLWGLGFGQSRQKFLYLPEAHTDSIFAIIAEENGFLRTSLLIILFGLLALRGYKIASEAPDTFSRLLATGITTWIIIQAFINIGAMLSVVPLTGIPIPFISYGGTSLTVLLAAVGILINISKYKASK